MQMKRKIIVLTVIIVLLLIVVLTNLDTKSSPSSNSVTYSQNEFPVYNQGGNILEYGDYTYFVDKYSNSIYRFNRKNASTLKIVESENPFEEKLFIINNNLIFSTNYITYYVSLNGDSNGKYEKFIDGKVLYMTEDLYLYVKKTTSISYLYISSYDSKTLSSTNKMFYTLALGHNINFLKQLGDELYFTSTNSDDSASLFSIDLKNYKTTLIVREFLNDEVNTYLKFNDVVKTDELIYYVLSTNELTTATKPNTRYYLYTRNIEYDYKEFSAEDVEPYLYADPKDENNVLYQRYTEYSVEPVWNEEVSDWKEFVYGDVTRFFEINNSTLTREGDKFVNLGQDYSNYELEYVYRLNGSLYVLISNESEMRSLYFCNEDGSNLSKII